MNRSVLTWIRKKRSCRFNYF